MRENIFLMLAILAALGVVMLGGALIEGNVSAPVLLALATCSLAARGFYRLGTGSAPGRRRARRHAGRALGAARSAAGLRAA